MSKTTDELYSKKDKISKQMDKRCCLIILRETDELKQSTYYRAKDQKRTCIQVQEIPYRCFAACGERSFPTRPPCLARLMMKPTP